MNVKFYPVRLVLALTLLAAGACGDYASPGVDEPFPDNVDAAPSAGDPDIDLSEYELTFNEDFRRRLSVSGADCNKRWFAHTPWNGDFGAARFSDPEPGFPFVTKHGMLRIEARNENGWKAGLLSSRNPCGEGFAQQYGYFEIRTMLPPGDGFWPAFWLIGVDRSRYTAEIDVFEHHSIRPGRFTITIHVHPRADGVDRVLDGELVEIEDDLLYRGFNTFGVSVEEDEMIFYFNRKEMWRTSTSEHFRQPMFILLNLAMEEGEITENTPQNAYMYVDYVRAYQRKPAP